MILKPSGIGQFFAGFTQEQHQGCRDLVLLTDFLSESSFVADTVTKMNGERDSFDDDVHGTTRCCTWPF